MPYYNLYCPNERTYRQQKVDDIKQKDNPMLQLIIERIKYDITKRLSEINGLPKETIIAIVKEYKPQFIGMQTISCPTCKNLQIDVIVNDKTKIREDLWRSYELDRVMKYLMRDK